MLADLIDIFDEERICEYRGEVYSVRDNGAVMHILVMKRNQDALITNGLLERLINNMDTQLLALFPFIGLWRLLF